VPPEALDPPSVEVRGLKPLLKISKFKDESVDSELVKLGYKFSVTTLFGERDVSRICQEAVESVLFSITNAGLNPVYTNGPSELPLPV